MAKLKNDLKKFFNLDELLNEFLNLKEVKNLIAIIDKGYAN